MRAFGVLFLVGVGAAAGFIGRHKIQQGMDAAQQAGQDFLAERAAKKAVQPDAAEPFAANPSQ